jgi:chromosome segregation ATPase
VNDLTGTTATDASGRTGRPTEYEDDQVISAGHKLQEAGRRVTGYALRREVGGGDPNRHIRTWRSYVQQQEVVESEPVQELPVEVEELLKEVTTGLASQINAMAVRLNTMAVQTAERRVSDVMASARETQEQAEAELADAAATVEDLEDQLGYVRAEGIKASSRANKAEESLKSERDRANALERDLAVLKEKLDGEREQRETAEKAGVELQERNAELKQDKADLRSEREQMQGQVDKLREKVDSLQGERDNLSETRAELKAQLASQAEREASALRRAEQAEQEKRDAIEGSKEAGRRAVQFETEAKQVRTQLDSLMKRVSVAGEKKADSKALKKQDDRTSGA